MITVHSTGSFKNTQSFLSRMVTGDRIFAALEEYGQQGVDALASATPVDTGLTASSWYSTVARRRGKYSITWHNSNIDSGELVSILIEYGHATGTGGWVEGYDYINPVIQPLFDTIANDIWEEVKNA